MTLPASPEASPASFGALLAPDTLRIERRLPGPIERVWAYLTDPDLRRQWLAAGAMDARTGGAFELVWRNDQLSDPPSQRPEGFSEEQRMQGTVLACDPPRTLVITWEGTGEVTFGLAPVGGDVLLTVTHARLPARRTLLMVGAGWHTHLDLLVACVSGGAREPFWPRWAELRDTYERLLTT